jgi:hypothetical protein
MFPPVFSSGKGEMADEKSRYYARLFWLQSAARDILYGERVGACCRVSIPGRNVQVWGRTDIRRAKYRNVIRCANVWQCPVCANHITSHRRDELQTVISTLDACIPVMISFTVSHHSHDRLDTLIEILAEAWRGMTTCKCFTAYRKDNTTRGHVRSVEVTWGKANGWHPHYHALFFLQEPNRIAGFYADIRTLWAEHVDKAGGSSTWEHGCSLTVCDESIAAYVAKWGHEPSEDTLPQLTRWGKAQELTRGPMKQAEKGRYTPFEMLEEYLMARNEGPAYWGRLYRVYAEAMKGQRQLTWSRTPDLRKAAGLRDEKTEAEVVEGEEAGYILLAQMDAEQWGAVLWAGMRGVILDCCARGDVTMAYDVIEDCCREHLKAVVVD